MRIIKIIWTVIAVIWLLLTMIGLAQVSLAETALQASQVYNGATVQILAIIAITGLLNQSGNPPKDRKNQENNHSPVAEIKKPPVNQKEETLLCPKCGSTMTIKTVAKGEYAGKQVYVCSNRPICQEIIFKG